MVEQSSRPAPRSRTSVLAFAGGFALAAVIAAVLAVTGVLPTGDSDDGPSSAAVSLPVELGSYVRFADATVNQDGRADAAVANIEATDRRTQAALADAYGGAGAAVVTYTDDHAETGVSVWAVRAPSADPVVTATDAGYLGLAEPPERIVRVGEDACDVRTVVSTPAGRTPPADSDAVAYCQRSSGDLTVRVNLSGGTPLTHDPKEAAALLDQAWNAIG